MALNFLKDIKGDLIMLEMFIVEWGMGEFEKTSPMMSFMEFKAMMEIIDQKISPK